MDQQFSQSAMILAAVVAVASIGTWFFILPRFKRPEGVLPSAPRVSVSWTGWHVLLVVMTFLLMQGAGASLSGMKFPTDPEELEASESDSETPSADEYAGMISYVSLFNLLAVGAAVSILMFSSQAKSADFGWLEDEEQLPRDVAIGVLGFLAATLPVLSLQMLVTMLMPYEHPVLSMLSEGGSPRFWLVAALSAAVVAPLAEEFLFRVVLQGWLERLALGKNDGVSLRKVETDEGETLFKLERQPVTAKAVWPIWVSATVFAMLHIGQGPAPIPLLLLGAMLGYLYRQTHRIVPCVVMHSLFNTFSLVLFWLSLSPNE